MHAIENEDITELLIPEDDVLNFHAPSYNAIRSAYSKSFKAKPVTTNTRIRIEELFPKNSNNNPGKNEDPGFSIDQDNDPLFI